MFNRYTESSDLIGAVLNENDSTLYEKHVKLIEEYGEIYQAYIQVVEPISTFTKCLR